MIHANALNASRRRRIARYIAQGAKTMRNLPICKTLRTQGKCSSCRLNKLKN